MPYTKVDFTIQMQVDEDEIYWRQKKGDEELEWSYSSAHIISQLTQCFGERGFQYSSSCCSIEVND